MGAIAIGLFVLLFAFGEAYLGWSDPHGHIQLALIATYVLGVISGYRGKS